MPSLQQALGNHSALEIDQQIPASPKAGQRPSTPRRYRECEDRHRLGKEGEPAPGATDLLCSWSLLVPNPSLVWHPSGAQEFYGRHPRSLRPALTSPRPSGAKSESLTRSHDDKDRHSQRNLRFRGSVLEYPDSSGPRRFSDRSLQPWLSFDAMPSQQQPLGNHSTLEIDQYIPASPKAGQSRRVGTLQDAIASKKATTEREPFSS